ncbi:MAG: STAS domain-containing protein [Armatimonadetes bacterium]|nr:STAS domain-containing protein [Armatimonadota bacterium]
MAPQADPALRLNLRVVPLEDDIAVVELEGDIDVYTAPMLLQTLEELQTRRIVIDLRNVSYLDSFGLGTFVKCLKNLQESGGSLRLVHCHWRIERLLSVTGLVNLFDLYQDRDAALKFAQAE